MPIPATENTRSRVCLNGGVEVIVYPGEAPAPHLSLDVVTSYVVTQNGTSVILADGTEGQIKEVVNGGPAGGPHVSTASINLQSTNSAFGGNDALVMPAGSSVRLVWSAALGGWAPSNVCANVNSLWD